MSNKARNVARLIVWLILSVGLGVLWQRLMSRPAWAAYSPALYLAVILVVVVFVRLTSRIPGLVVPRVLQGDTGLPNTELATSNAPRSPVTAEGTRSGRRSSSRTAFDWTEVALAFKNMAPVRDDSSGMNLASPASPAVLNQLWRKIGPLYRRDRTGSSLMIDPLRVSSFAEHGVYFACIVEQDHQLLHMNSHSRRPTIQLSREAMAHLKGIVAYNSEYEPEEHSYNQPTTGVIKHAEHRQAILDFGALVDKACSAYKESPSKVFE